MKLEYKKLVTEKGVPFKYLTINGQNTYRSYFGRYNWLPDETGFICGTEDGSFYYYNVAAQELTFLDKAREIPKDQPFVATYVNPSNGLVYYTKYDDEGFMELWSIDPYIRKPKHIYTAESKRMVIGLEVTNDGRYTYYFRKENTVLLPEGEKWEFGRVDLENKRIDRTRFYGFNESNHINHYVINPGNPDLLLFHHETVGGVKPKDRLTVMNLSTGEVFPYKQPGDIAVHAFWSRDGKKLIFADMYCATWMTVTDEKFGNRKEWYVDWEYGGANHNTADDAFKYALTDDWAGIAFVKLETNEVYCITRQLPNYYKRHCNHPHPEITASGRIGSWGWLDENETVGIAWLDTSYFDDKQAEKNEIKRLVENE